MGQGGFRLNSSLRGYGFKRLVLVFCAIGGDSGEADWAGEWEVGSPEKER